MYADTSIISPYWADNMYLPNPEIPRSTFHSAWTYARELLAKNWTHQKQNDENLGQLTYPPMDIGKDEFLGLLLQPYLQRNFDIPEKYWRHIGCTTSPLNTNNIAFVIDFNQQDYLYPHLNSRNSEKFMGPFVNPGSKWKQLQQALVNSNFIGKRVFDGMSYSFMKNDSLIGLLTDDDLIEKSMDEHLWIYNSQTKSYTKCDNQLKDSEWIGAPIPLKDKFIRKDFVYGELQV